MTKHFFNLFVAGVWGMFWGVFGGLFGDVVGCILVVCWEVFKGWIDHCFTFFCTWFLHCCYILVTCLGHVWDILGTSLRQFGDMCLMKQYRNNVLLKLFICLILWGSGIEKEVQRTDRIGTNKNNIFYQIVRTGIFLDCILVDFWRMLEVSFWTIFGSVLDVFFIQCWMIFGRFISGCLKILTIFKILKILKIMKILKILKFWKFSKFSKF